MDARELIEGSLIYVGALSPFLLVFGVVSLADDLIPLIRHAAGVIRRRGDY